VQSFRKSFRPRLQSENVLPAWHEEQAASELPDSTMPILEAFVCETHSAALLAGTIASAVNAF
jgi:hypothetical protein